MGAALNMLERAIAACPEELWSRPSKEMGFWFMAYHTLYYVDHDLTRVAEGFESPAFDVHRYESDQLDPPYEHPYSESELLAYLQACRDKCRRTIENLRHDARDLLGCDRLESDGFEVVLYHLRHVQHHVAQLNQLLRQTVREAPPWVRRATL